REELPCRFVPDHNDTPGFVVVDLRKQTPAIDFDGPDLLKHRPHSTHLQCCGVVCALDRYTTSHDFRTLVFQQLRMGLQRNEIGHIETHHAACTLAARLLTGSSIADDQNVRAEFAQNPVVTALKAFAERRQDDDRDHTPHDSEHGEEASDLVGLQVLPDL